MYIFTTRQGFNKLLKYLSFGALILLIGFIISTKGNLVSRLFPVPENLVSIGTRFELWKGGIKLIKARPIFGYGPDTLSTMYPSVMTPDLLRFENLRDRPDRLHNHILDYTYEFGIIGLLIYLIFLYTVIKEGFRSSRFESKLISIGLLGVLLCDFFGFFVITNKVYFWFFLFLIIF